MTLTQRAQLIQLVIFDVDGVLTDGTLYYGASGEYIKAFNVRDGIGLKLLQNESIEVAIITAKNSPILLKRLQYLKIKHIYTGCIHKIHAYNELKSCTKLQNKQIAYVGDDVQDIPVMKQVGLAIAPKDAYTMTKNCAQFITHHAGGQGVAREIADLLVGTQTNLQQAYDRLVDPLQ